MWTCQGLIATRNAEISATGVRFVSDMVMAYTAQMASVPTITDANRTLNMFRPNMATGIVVNHTGSAGR